MEEQQKQKPKRLARLIIFLSTAQGQVVANCCAYGSLVCIAISASSSDYSRLALPFAIVTPLLAFLGTASRSQRRIAQVALALWVIPVNIMVPVLFNLGTQVGQQTQLQTQIVQLENLHKSHGLFLLLLWWRSLPSSMVPYRINRPCRCACYENSRGNYDESDYKATTNRARYISSPGINIKMPELLIIERITMAGKSPKKQQQRRYKSLSRSHTGVHSR